MTIPIANDNVRTLDFILENLSSVTNIMHAMLGFAARTFNERPFTSEALRKAIGYDPKTKVGKNSSMSSLLSHALIHNIFKPLVRVTDKAPGKRTSRYNYELTSLGLSIYGDKTPENPVPNEAELRQIRQSVKPFQAKDGLISLTDRLPIGNLPVARSHESPLTRLVGSPDTANLPAGQYVLVPAIHALPPGAIALSPEKAIALIEKLALQNKERDEKIFQLSAQNEALTLEHSEMTRAVVVLSAAKNELEQRAGGPSIVLPANLAALLN